MQLRRTPRGRASLAKAVHYQIEALEGRTLLTTFVVTNTDGDAGQLRVFINQANANPGPDTIVFDVPGTGVHTLRPTFPLPDITDPLTIDATTQPGFSITAPTIELNGSRADEGLSSGVATGLNFTVGGNTVKGLIINNFSGSGILLNEPGLFQTGGSTIAFNFIGTDATGKVAKPNSGGIHLGGTPLSSGLVGSPNNTIAHNLISGNNGDGIEIDFATSSGNHIEDNFIGTDVTGLAALGNRLNGVSMVAPNVPFLRQGNDDPRGYASGNFVGGKASALGDRLPAGNIIAGNTQAGVYIFRGHSNEVQGNLIGVGVDGITPIPNGTAGTDASFGADGVFIEEGSVNGVGGVLAGQGNVISSNIGDGVRINAPTRAATNNDIEGNLIGTTADGLLPRGNREGVRIEGASGNTVGGGTDAERNVISANHESGVLIIAFPGGPAASNNFVTGNYIGTDKTGNRIDPDGMPGTGDEMGNKFGVFIQNGDHNTIGRMVVDQRIIGAENYICGNVNIGVAIAGALAQHNAVQANSVGVGVNSAKLGNATGIQISQLKLDTGSGGSASLNTIGGDTSVFPLENVISANTGIGLLINVGAHENTVLGNYIGTDEGNRPLGNGGSGVFIDAAPGNFIGTSAGGNIIVNNVGNGVTISGATSTGNLIQHNLIGVGADGAAHPNFNGVSIFDAPSNTVGGALVKETGNVISGNLATGVLISGSHATGNQILGNYIGVDASGGLDGDGGIDPRPNGNVGVIIQDGPSGTIIGAPGDAGRNIISGNKNAGIEILGTVAAGGTNSNSILNNYIGLRADGFHPAPNSGPGILIQDSPGNVIGGDAGKRNFISGNIGSGISLVGFANGTMIKGNSIGLTDSALPIDEGNHDAGIILTFGSSILTPQNTSIIGNIIAGNLKWGIAAFSDAQNGGGGERNTTIQGNFIGTDSTLGNDLGNRGWGILLSNTAGTHIGGTTPALANVIAFTAFDPGSEGFTGQGIEISGEFAQGNTVEGNRIIGNLANGIRIGDGASLNMIGTTTSGGGNVIILNHRNGILITGENTARNTVEHNLIGVDEKGAAKGNTISGVQLFDSTHENQIGSAGADSTNVISGNDQGVLLAGGAHNNSVQGNDIGTSLFGAGFLGNHSVGVGLVDAPNNFIGGIVQTPGSDSGNLIIGSGIGIGASGAASTGNLFRGNLIKQNVTDGVQFINGASNNTVGGPEEQAGNEISKNGGAGVFVGSGTGNAIRHNQIFSNTGLGIDLAPVGVTANDEKAKDADHGPNELQNFPVLTSATVKASTRIAGYLFSAASTTYTLEFFQGFPSAARPDQVFEGRKFLFSTTVTTNASGRAFFDIDIAPPLVLGFITATATDPNGNTSEFSRAILSLFDRDGDGVGDELEGSSAHQSNVATLPDAGNVSSVTLASPGGTTLSNVSAFPNPSPDDAPAGVGFNLGFFSFKVNGVAVGGATTVTLSLPAVAAPRSYFRYGPTPDNAAPHWYAWNFDGTTGAEINGNQVILHFVDGQLGDDDLTANGSITDAGGPAFAPPILVTNTDDSGPGSLRQAILDANARPGFDFINFDIGAGGPATIMPLSDLPTLTDRVFIDAASQDGFIDRPIIELDGKLDPFGTGLTAIAFDTTIRGFVINRFAAAGISITPPSSNSQNDVVIEGNYIGTDVTGMLAQPNGAGIVVNGGAFHRIGGTTPEQRNVISGNSLDGILLSGAFGGFSLQVQGNYIGVAADGATALGNGSNGVSVNKLVFGLTVGGLADGAGNIIAFNHGSGISNLAPNRNDGFLSNSIYSNGLLGITFDPNGKFVLNDLGASDTSGSNLQNYPVLASAASSGGQTTITGYLNSRRNSGYTLQFFSNTSINFTGFGEGQTLLGTASVHTDASGHVDFSVLFPVTVPDGLTITATATDSTNNTSELSRRVGVGEVVTNIIIVNSADDTDDGVADATHTSLREAIHAANNFPGPNEIRFAIGSGVHTIHLLSPLPAIVEGVTIDGTTQPGFAGAPIIELDGAALNPPVVQSLKNPFVGPGASGLTINASNTTVRGLVINGLARILIDPITGVHSLQTVGSPGIDVYSIGAEATFAGVVIEGNYIGTDVTGMLARPNSGGIVMRDGNNDRIGGTSPAQRNVISGNAGDGVEIFSAGYLIQGNFVGVGADGTTPLGNTNPDLAFNSGGSGILGLGPNGMIGGLAAGAGNVIAFNARHGVDVGDGRSGTAILSNSIHSNFLLGISYDRNDDNVILNEETLLFDPQGRIVKYPVLHSAQSAGGQTTISGHFDGKTNSTVLLQFFSNAVVDASGFGEGETLIGSTSVTTDANGHVEFTAAFPVAVADRRLITATATDSGNNTSQFSRRIAVGEVITDHVITVNTTDDIDDGTADATHTSLREAIQAANNNPGTDTIRFAIGSGVQTISPLTPLPAIVDSIVVDGWTQPGFAGTPIIEISGAQMDRKKFHRPSATEFYMYGINVIADNSTVRGLVINRFFVPLDSSINDAAAGSPLSIAGDNNVIEGNYIGTNPAGTSALGSQEPVRITGSNNRIGGATPQQRNLFDGTLSSGSGSTSSVGISILGDSNVLEGNYIGTNAAGTAAIGNTNGGAFVQGSGNLIGGAAPGTGNLISGNGGDGLEVFGPGNIIQGNLIGINAAGTTTLRNSGYGLFVSMLPNGPQAPPILVGGTQPGEGNIISGNSTGIITNGGDILIQGNFIGTDITGTVDLGNATDGIFLNSGDRLVIGGTESGAGNLISGNDRFGILIARSDSTGHRIQGNRIGTKADGVSALGNGSDGIVFASGFSGDSGGTGPVDSLIGGTDPGAGNIIAFNAGRGVNIAAGRRVGILSNSIFSNGQLGIDLNADGVTPNDAGDADTGDNELQNFPVLIAAVSDGSRTTVTGNFNSSPNAGFFLQFFASDAGDPSGFGEGQTFLGTHSVVTDASGNGSFTFSFPIAVAPGKLITATATDTLNNTSEFSQTFALVSGATVPNRPPVANAGGPYTINEGDGLTFNGSLSDDPDSDPITLAWDINGDGVFTDATGVKPSFTWSQLQALGIVNGPSSFNVKVRVDDGQGHVVTSSAAVLNVLNVAPIVDAGPTVLNAFEGDAVKLTGAFTDPGTADTQTLNWHVSASNGQVIADGNAPTFEFVPADNGVYTVTFTVTDSDGAPGTASVQVNVFNVTPTAAMVGLPAHSTVGAQIDLTPTVTDPSPVDTAAGFTYLWDVILQSDSNVEIFARTHDFSFTPPQAGAYDVFLFVTDKDSARFVDRRVLEVSDAAPQFNKADFNHSGKVDFADLLILAQNYGKTGATNATGDANGDGKVDFSDLLILAQNYNKTGPQAGKTKGSMLSAVVGLVKTH